MEQIETVVDSRERELIKLLPETIKIEPLHIGDIQFQKSGQNVLLLERKTMADLASSIKDGRYHEQKARLMASAHLHMTGYIFEGPLRNIGGISSKTLIGAITNTFVRDKMVVFRTMSLQETATFVKSMAEKIAKFGLERGPQPVMSEDKYVSAISKIKKSNMTPMMCFMCQLSQIPGVSAKIAKIISGEYKTMARLIEAYQNVQNKEGMLNDLTIPNSAGTRRIGPVASKRIYEYLFDNQSLS